MFGDEGAVYVGAQTLVCKVPRGPTVYLSVPQKSRGREKAQRLGLWAPREVGDG